jgi:hypothetical protein
MDDQQKKIQQRAYEIYLKHKQPGKDMENWLQAEREVAAEINRSKKNTPSPVQEKKPAVRITTSVKPIIKKK